MTRRAQAVPQQPGAYLIHADQPIRHAQHYLGSAADIPTRIQTHRDGTGARLTAAFNDRGIGWHVSRTWPTATPEQAVQTEIGLKNRRESPRFCPDCNPGAGRVAVTPTLSSHRTGPRHPPIRKPAVQADPWALAKPPEPETEPEAQAG
jgi:predicted GIY-YIG superfamily endonuclease